MNRQININKEVNNKKKKHQNQRKKIWQMILQSHIIFVNNKKQKINTAKKNKR